MLVAIAVVKHCRMSVLAAVEEPRAEPVVGSEKRDVTAEETRKVVVGPAQ